jgi:hypothetical protein
MNPFLRVVGLSAIILGSIAYAGEKKENMTRKPASAGGWTCFSGIYGTAQLPEALATNKCDNTKALSITPSSWDQYTQDGKQGEHVEGVLVCCGTKE